MRGIKTLGIRQWLFVGIAVFLASAAIIYHFASTFDQVLVQPESAQAIPQQNSALATALHDATSNPANWHDQAWQSSLQTELSNLNLQAVILDPSGNEIFRTGFIQPGSSLAREVVVVSGGQQIGAVDLYVSARSGFVFGGQQTSSPDPFGAQRNNFVPPLVVGLSVLIALLFVQWQMGRYVVKPLEAMSVAARRIASGNLDFELPASRVREVADVREAFEAMGEGLRGSIERQAQLEEERRFFIGAIAHDLRTPLFSLRGYLEGFEHGLASSPEKVAQYIAVCRQKADQLDRLVSDLFAYARVEYLAPTLQTGGLDLGLLLRRIVEGAGAMSRQKGVALKISGTPGACQAEGDEHLLERAVENLLDNALRYTPSGGTVEISWRCAPDRVIFTVADTGPGIPAADMPHLFDPLFRGETSRNRQTGGAGLGLAIARRALLSFGGDLTARNLEGGGAEFTGWLPAHASAPALS